MSERATAPVDPRLLRRAAPVRRLFALGALLAAVQAGAILLFSWCVAEVIAGLIAGERLDAFFTQMLAMVVALLARFLSVWLAELFSKQAAAKVKTQLRNELVHAYQKIGPVALASQRSGELVTVAGRGLDSLDAYFSRYLPQLLNTAVITPVLLAVLFLIDFWTGLVILVALPLIPVFMALIGWVTESVQKKQWQALSHLAASFVELIDGLTTLKIFGREHRQTERLRSITEDYRVRTLKVLRVSFLSSFVLELAASLSVALVAVSIGIRLLDGTILLAPALFLLILAPEVFLPVRQVGTQFHASTEGVAAVTAAFDLLDSVSDSQSVSSGIAQSESRGEQGAGELAGKSGAEQAVILSDLRSGYGEHEVLRGLSLRVAPGSVTVLSGASGSGKSTLVATLLGFVETRGGEARIAGKALTAQRIAWSPQQPKLLSGTVTENILAGADYNGELVAQVSQLAALPEELLGLSLGEYGDGLSGGQAARVSLARCYYRALRLRSEGEAVLVIVDEPTAALDKVTEDRVLDGLMALADQGFPVLVLSHRQAILERGVQHLQLDAGVLRVSEGDAQ